MGYQISIWRIGNFIIVFLSVKTRVFCVYIYKTAFIINIINKFHIFCRRKFVFAILLLLIFEKKISFNEYFRHNTNDEFPFPISG